MLSMVVRSDVWYHGTKEYDHEVNTMPSVMKETAIYVRLLHPVLLLYTCRVLRYVLLQLIANLYSRST